MQCGNYIVIANFKVRDGCQAKFQERLAIHASNSRAEAGCLLYRIASESEDAGSVWLYEIYTGAEAYAQHQALPSYSEFRSAALKLADFRFRRVLYDIEVKNVLELP